MSNDDELRLSLLGSPKITRGDDDLIGDISTKGQALLCYLAVTRQPQTRQKLAWLLWGNRPEANARRSLRVALAKLPNSIKPHLIANRQFVELDRNSNYWCDVETFEHFVQQSDVADGAVARARLREAVNLYQNEFLDGFDVGDAVDFEEWMTSQREQLRQMALRALDRLVDICIEQKNLADGIIHANRLLELDPWREKGHRQLMWLLARNGQRTAALMQYERCRDLLDMEFGVEPEEETKALHLEIQEMDKHTTQTKPLPPLPAEDEVFIPFQAPAPVPYFVNRQHEITHYGTMLAQSNGRRRVYCFVGMGGIGKTALVTSLAYNLREKFADGVLWANAATSDPMAVAESWARAYGYDFSGLPDMDSRAAALRGMLAEKQALLVLDNVTSAARVRALLPGGGSCAVLLTTRNVELAHALDAQPVNLAELSSANGRQLLAAIIGEERVAAEETAAAEICRLLHNLPMAVAIAAQRLAARPRRKLADMAARLRDEAERLDLRLRDRQVRTSFGVSWESLDQMQRRIFALLAVFEGRAFTAEALAAVAQMEHYPAQDRLDSLVALSLLNEEGERHYRQHSLLADFAHERLGEDRDAYGRMVHYYLQYAHTHGDNYEALRPEWENLGAAIRTAYEMHLWQTVIDFTGALQEAWFARGRYTEARQAYQWACEASETLEDKSLLATYLLQWGRACIEQSDHSKAKALLNQSLEIYQEIAGEKGIADAKYELSRIALEQGPHYEAERLLEECRQIRQRLGDRGGLAETIYREARVLHHRGDYEGAKRLGQEALSMQEVLDDKLGTIRTLRLLTDSLLQLPERDFDLATQYCRRALKLCEELQDRAELAITLLTLSRIHRTQGNLDLARQHAEESFKLLAKMGDRRSQALVLFQLSRIYYAMKKHKTAIAFGHRSLNLCRKLGDELGMVYVWQFMGDLYFEREQQEQAYEVWSRALEIAQKLRHSLLIGKLDQRIEKLASDTQKN